MAPMDRSRSKPIAVTVGRTAASCPNCGGKAFMRKQIPPEADSEDIYVCIGCSTETPRGTLVEQIVNKVIAENRRVLDALQARNKV
jgi:DNA-directed RNA polymerase subunit RPC12/RpoP